MKYARMRMSSSVGSRRSGAGAPAVCGFRRAGIFRAAVDFVARDFVPLADFRTPLDGIALGCGGVSPPAPADSLSFVVLGFFGTGFLVELAARVGFASGFWQRAAPRVRCGCA